MHRSTSTTRRACALGTTFALIGLTTGLGVFTSTAAYAADGDASTAVVQPADQSQTGSTPTDASTGASTEQPDASDSPAASDPAPSNAATPDETPTSEPTGAATSPADTGAKTTAPSTAVAPAAETPAAAATVTIVGDAKVGTTLRYDSTGISNPSSAVWTVDETTVAEGPSFTLTKDQIGKKVTLTVTGSTPEQTATDTTAVVTEDVVAADETTADAPLPLTVTAGTALSRSFAVKAGSGDVTYSVGYSDPSYVSDPSDPTDTPDAYLPDDVTLDPTTGLLSGTPTSAGVYDFTVVATNGTSTTTEYVEVVVDPAAAVGVMAYATDTSSAEFFDSLDDEGNPKLTHPINE